MSAKQRAKAQPTLTQAIEAGKPFDPRVLEVEPTSPPKDQELPTCAVVILNLNGKHHLEGCFDTLKAVDYPADKLEVILIDNASTDGSVEEMRRRHDWVRLIVNPNNVGFASGCNQGAREAGNPDVLVFLNNDMRFEADFLKKLVAPIVAGHCDATTAKMLSWDGKAINSAGGGMNFHGIGIQRGYMEVPGPRHEVPRWSLFACGGSMAIRRTVFETVGGFDDEFFAYYEDVDLGWRMWVQGYTIQYAPSAVCYHHHSSTSRRLPKETIRLLQIRNPLLACFKNYDDANLRAILPVMLALATRRARIVSGVTDDTPFRVERASMEEAPRGLSKLLRRATGETYPISRIGAADLIGVNDLLGRMEHWKVRRAQVQKHRRRPDAEIFPLFLRPLWCVEGEPAYGELQNSLAQMYGLDQLFAGLTSENEDPQG